MTGMDGFLEQEPDELEAFLLAHARREVAPPGARERALLGVTQVALGAAGLAAVATLGARSSLFKASAWLAAKWLLFGLAGGLAALTATHALRRLASSSPTQPRSTADSPSAPAASVGSVAPQEPSGAEAARVAAPASAPHSPKLAPPPSTPLPSAAEHEAPRNLVPAPSSTVDAVSASELVRELAVLERARTALSVQAGPRAVQALDEYGAEFPQGALRAEAAALRVEAVGLGDPTRGSELAVSFLRNYPTSPLSARVRALAEGYRGQLQKP